MGIPRPKAGQLKVGYGKLANQHPDIIVASGEGTAKVDRNLMLNFLSAKSHSPFDNTWHPSLIEELVERGYDITTLRISISKINQE